MFHSKNELSSLFDAKIKDCFEKSKCFDKNLLFLTHVPSTEHLDRLLAKQLQAHHLAKFRLLVEE